MKNRALLLLPLPPQSISPMAASPPSAAPSMSQTRPPHPSLNLSPPLIAMMAVTGTAFLIILYTHVISHFLRLLRRRRRRRRNLLFRPGTSPHPSTGSFNSSSDFFFYSSPYGLDEPSIKNLPTSLFSKTKAKHLACMNRDCAVCLLEFEDDDLLRTLPYCSHSFHVDCIDVWLRFHATCPLCRSSVTRPDFISYSPFVPMRASRIRPSIDDLLLDSEISEAAPVEISLSVSPQQNFFLKRSYSFGFERGPLSERMVLEASTASPWRFRNNHRSNFWSKRSSNSRVFSFRSSLRKSPFTRRRGGSSLLTSVHGGPGPSSRRTRSMGFYSSRMRCGDPEALLSPERLTNR